VWDRWTGAQWCPRDENIMINKKGEKSAAVLLLSRLLRKSAAKVLSKCLHTQRVVLFVHW
jgi:hypothetical protein